MARVVGSLGRPIHGISQQPFNVRMEGQCTDCVNLVPDVVQGLTTRAGYNRASKLATPIISGSLIHTYRRVNELYTLVIPPSLDSVRVIRENGAEAGVYVNNVMGNPFEYLKGASVSDIKTLTVADTTYLLNTKKVIQKGTSRSPVGAQIGLVYFQFADYGMTYSVYVDGAERARLQTPDGSLPEHKAQIDTTKLAATIEGQLNGNLSSSGFTVTRVDNVIILKHPSHKFKLSTVDGADGGNLIAIRGSVSDVSKLPDKAPSGMTIAVQPKGGTDLEVFWLKAEPKEDSTVVFWKESIAPDTVFGLDSNTMPICLKDVTTDPLNPSFELIVNKWTDRQVGNEKLNPDPSFVGMVADSIGVFQNRLYLTAGESISMTRSSEFFNFYRESTQTIVDTDPYDMYSDSAEVVNFRESLAFDGDVILFSDGGQYVLRGDEVVSPNNLVPLSKATSFEVQEGTTPVSSGESIFFPYNFGRYTGIREFFTDSLVDTKRARPITDHVNQLIVGKVKKMRASSSLNKLVVQSEGSNELYVYDWVWQGTDKVQSAWSKWDLGEHELLDFNFFESTLVLLMNQYGSTYICTMSLGLEPDIPTVPYPFRLDNKVEVEAEYFDGIWSIPDALPDVPFEDLVAVLGDGGYEEYQGTEMELINRFTVFDEDYSDKSTIKVFLGTRIEAKYTPSNPYPKDADGTARSGLDRLQVSTVYFNYNYAGACKSVVKSEWGKESVKDLSPRVFGSFNNIVGFAPAMESTYAVPVRSKYDQFTLTLTTNSTVPIQIREVEYSGTYYPRSRRM